MPFRQTSGEDGLRILDGVPTPCLVLDCGLKIVTANKAYLSVTSGIQVSDHNANDGKIALG